MKTLELKKNIYWTGVQDSKLRVFDIVMYTEFGTSYNSYIVKGSEKVALFETAKAKFLDEYLSKVEELVDIEKVDYIIVNHTEPDHAGSARVLLEKNPAIKLVGSASAINFMKEITNISFNSIIVKDGDELSLGDKTLKFISAPNLHWPDSMYTYVVEDKVLFTCDSFGCHYSFDDVLQSKLTDDEGYFRALRHYYDCIMSPFKSWMLSAVDKIKDLELDIVCPGHGPVLDSDPWKIINLNKEWSCLDNPNTKKTVVMPYVSAYGYTLALANKMKEGILDAGDIEVKTFDLVTEEKGKVLEEIAHADGILVGTPTMVGEALKPIWDLVTDLYPVTAQGKIASAFGSYGWSGEGVPNIMERLRQLKLKVYGDGYRVRLNPSDPQLEGAYQYGYEFGLCVKEGKIVTEEDVREAKAEVRAWKCLVCGEIVYSSNPPESCPVCGVGAEQFVEVEVNEVDFKSESEEYIMILGGGVAGLTAAEAIRERNKVCKIDIVSEEAVPCYNRPMLTKGILSGFEKINFYTKPESWYKDNNIGLILNTKVTALDLKTKTVTLSTGEAKKYDKLIYALGAECNIPPIPGHDKEGVCVVRKLSDTETLRSKLNEIENVVVIGGGVLGLEGAWELSKAKKNVTVLEMFNGIMANQLDVKGSEFLRKAAEKSGLNIVTGCKIKEIKANSEGSVIGVETEDGVLHPADIVIVSAGIKPNSQIGVDAGLEGGRWIEVDKFMKSSDDSVWACGDVAVYDGVSIAIWPQSIEMAKVAGANTAGDVISYERIVPSVAFNGFGTALFSVGDIGKNPDGHYKSLEVLDETRNIYKKLYFDKGKFCGGILMGDISKSPLMMKVFEKKSNFKDPLILDLLED